MAKQPDPEIKPVPTSEQPPAEAAAPVVEPSKVGLPKWRVTVGERSEVIEAATDTDAWAMFCDAAKSWPSRKFSGAKVEQVA